MTERHVERETTEQIHDVHGGVPTGLRAHLKVPDKSGDATSAICYVGDPLVVSRG